MMQPARLQLRQAANVIKGGDSAGGDHRHRDGGGQLGQGLQVRALHHAVPADVGVNDRRQRPGGTTAGQVQGRQFELLAASRRWPPGRPWRRCPRRSGRETSGRQLSNQAGSRKARVPRTTRATPQRKGLGNVLLGAQAAAELARHAGRLDDPADAVAIDRPAVAGPVEVHEMEKLRPLADPALRHGGRVVAEDGFLRVVALPQPDALAASQVDGREDEHRVSFGCCGRVRR